MLLHCCCCQHTCDMIFQSSLRRYYIFVPYAQTFTFIICSLFFVSLFYYSGGGTSWEGTLQKLLSPGLLFHHETPTKDFFYDDMQPWVHYVPVDTNLGNLREQFEWAKAHPEEAQRIAQQGTDFAHYMLSKEYMDKKYKELFVDYLGDLVNAFDPSEKVRYPLDMQVHEISKCTKHGMCRTQVADGKYQSVRFEPK